MDSSLFSKHFSNPAGSPIRELFPYLSRPGMISFAGGYPSPSLFDTEGLRQASGLALATQSVFQYGPTEGPLPLREQLAALGRSRGVAASADQIIATTGAQQAFDLLLRVLINPGDAVLVETPAYPATLQALRLADARIIGIATDADGIDTEALQDRLEHPEPGERAPKLLYTVPNFSNPGGSRLSEARRRKLVSLAIEHGFLIAEDDPYGDLSFSGDKLASLYEHGQAQAVGHNPVLYLSSLSKTVAPALRVGWMVAPADLLRRCAIAKQTADLCSSPLTQAIAVEYLKLGRYEQAVQRMTQEYQQRVNCLADSLSRVMGDRVDFQAPGGGMFLWNRLTRAVDADALLQAAIRHNVLYVPGKAFYPQAPDACAMRLSFATTSTDDIREGVSRLRQALDTVG